MKRVIEKSGGFVLSALKSGGYGVLLVVESLLWLRAAFSKRREVLAQLYVCAVQSLPVTMLVGAFVGMVLALQTGLSLRQYGLQNLISQVAGASMTREMGHLMTAIILAGRVGSAMAAELGSMRVSEEIEALEVMSISPIKFLVMPRILALTLAAPILTVYANLIGIIGAAVVGNLQIGVGFYVFFRDCFNFVTFKDLYTGLAKSVVFGTTIAAVSCSEGMRCTGGTMGVGVATRHAVVVSLLMILLFNYIMTSLIVRFIY
ncbi:MAG: ABC transporter permease [Planctomycetota bacterium]|nr:ABC transporter permease [Planctomycetota bacterium]